MADPFEFEDIEESDDVVVVDNSKKSGKKVKFDARNGKSFKSTATKRDVAAKHSAASKPVPVSTRSTRAAGGTKSAVVDLTETSCVSI
jgi:hypothetical protein